MKRFSGILLITAVLCLTAACGRTTAPDETGQETAVSGNSDSEGDSLNGSAPEEDGSEVSRPASEDPAASLPEENISVIEPVEIEEEPPVDYTPQIRLLAENFDAWSMSSVGWPYTNCAVTDLDGNGRLEVIAYLIYGSGDFTYASIFEVNESCDGIAACTVPGQQDPLYPEFNTDGEPVRVYTGSDGVRHYLFTDIERRGAGLYYYTLMPLSLADGTLTLDMIGTKADERGVVTYTDIAGMSLSEAEYEALPGNYYSGSTESSVTISWMNLEGAEDITALLTESWSGFGEN